MKKKDIGTANSKCKGPEGEACLALRASWDIGSGAHRMKRREMGGEVRSLLVDQVM